jgi:molybdopterin/thiamine biosynthesis adenylyltransferase
MSDQRVGDRYSRQTLFAGIGPDGQRKLGQSSVVIVGCGAMGSALANNLVRAGVGRVRLVDRDFVELNNLQRQTLYDERDAAEAAPKAVAAARRLAAVNSEVTVEPVVSDFNADNAEELLEGMDLALDGSDNFETRYLLNDACVKLGKPWIYSGVIAAYGVSMTVLPGDTACLRCVFPDRPLPGTTPTPPVSSTASSRRLAASRPPRRSRRLRAATGWRAACSGWTSGRIPPSAWSCHASPTA